MHLLINGASENTVLFQSWWPSRADHPCLESLIFTRLWVTSFIHWHEEVDYRACSLLDEKPRQMASRWTSHRYHIPATQSSVASVVVAVICRQILLS